jgi:hypothetical protein
MIWTADMVDVGVIEMRAQQLSYYRQPEVGPSAKLRLLAGAKGPEAGKGCLFQKAWPKSFKGLPKGLKLFQKS